MMYDGAEPKRVTIFIVKHYGVITDCKAQGVASYDAFIGFEKEKADKTIRLTARSKTNVR